MSSARRGLGRAALRGPHGSSASSMIPWRCTQSATGETAPSSTRRQRHGARPSPWMRRRGTCCCGGNISEVQELREAIRRSYGNGCRREVKKRARGTIMPLGQICDCKVKAGAYSPCLINDSSRLHVQSGHERRPTHVHGTHTHHALLHDDHSFCENTAIILHFIYEVNRL